MEFLARLPILTMVCGGVASRGPVIIDPVEPGPTPYQVIIISEANWESVIYNNTGSANSSAAAGINILFNGASLYNIEASLYGTNLNADSAFGNLFLFGNHYHDDAFTVSLDLGTLNAGESFTLSYLMWAMAEHYSAEGETRFANASIGDPFGWGKRSGGGNSRQPVQRRGCLGHS